MKRVFGTSGPSKRASVLQRIVAAHVTDPSLNDFVSNDDLALTSLERGVQRWEQAHLVAALDILNAYQRDRKARLAYQVGSMRLARAKDFKHDARTRVTELLKRWLRSQAGLSNVGEDEVRGMAALCRDILAHPSLFPARNPRSFLQTIAEVYGQLQLQLKEALERDRSCSELARRVLSLSRNLVSDAVGFLLVAPTDLSQTDVFPSLEVVSLWQSLPDAPGGQAADATLQRAMQDVWRTQAGSAVAAVLSTAHCARLFGGSAVASASAALSEAKGPRNRQGAELKITEVEAELAKGSTRGTGLAGAFRRADDPSATRVRSAFVDALRAVNDLVYLLAEVLAQFHLISDCMGDYGMIRTADWLHPFLDALSEKVQRLRGSLEVVDEAVQSAYVLARARFGRVERPAPTERMLSRAHACAERALVGKDSHYRALTAAIDELKARSAPERLPAIEGSLGDACHTLQGLLTSQEFRAVVGDGFQRLPSLRAGAQAGTLALPPDASQWSSEASDSHQLTTEGEDEVSSGSCGDGVSGEESLCTTADTATAGRRRAKRRTREMCRVVEVWNLVDSKLGAGACERDRRLLETRAGRLRIFEPDLGEAVEAIMEPTLDIDACELRPDSVLVLSANRAVRGSAATQRKTYQFEFDTNSAAHVFFDHLQSLAQ